MTELLKLIFGVLASLFKSSRLLKNSLDEKNGM
jgi:hypothetical protein